jgi:hypothetical protein
MINERQLKLVKASQTKMAGLTQWQGFFTTDFPERQSRNQIELAARERKRSQRKNSISSCLCALCVPLRQKSSWKCAIFSYSGTDFTDPPSPGLPCTSGKPVVLHPCHLWHGQRNYMKKWRTESWRDRIIKKKQPIPVSMILSCHDSVRFCFVESPGTGQRRIFYHGWGKRLKAKG